MTTLPRPRATCWRTWPTISAPTDGSHRHRSPTTPSLFDYPLWWVTCSWDYVLYTGDRSYASRYYPNLLKVLDTWYPSVSDSAGLLSKGLNGTGGYGDYAFLDRTGRITYYNANYVQALNDAARLARWLGREGDAERWSEGPHR